MIGVRLKEERERVGLTQSTLAKEIGKGLRTVGGWENGETFPDASYLQILASLGMDINYIITGNKLLVPTKSELDVNAPIKDEYIPSKDEYIYIPVYDIEASAGHGREGSDPEPVRYHAFRKRWADFHNFIAKNLLVIKVKGDSMEPAIKDRSHIVVNKGAKEPIDGRIFVIRKGNSLLIKYIQIQFDDSLLLMSDNEFYKPISLTKEDLECDSVEVLGEVVHCSTDFI